MSTHYHHDDCNCAHCRRIAYNNPFHPAYPVTMEPTSAGYDPPAKPSVRFQEPGDHHAAGRSIPGRYEDEDSEYSDGEGADHGEQSREDYRFWTCGDCDRRYPDDVVDCPSCTRKSEPRDRPQEGREASSRERDALTVNLTILKGTRVVIDTSGEDEDRKAAETETKESDGGDPFVIVEEEQDWEDAQKQDETEDEYVMISR